MPVMGNNGCCKAMNEEFFVHQKRGFTFPDHTVMIGGQLTLNSSSAL